MLPAQSWDMAPDLRRPEYSLSASFHKPQVVVCVIGHLVRGQQDTAQ